MAKLGPYYSLCPLVESRSLLGLSPDSEKGTVIVTFGKNVAGKYKLSDQKQMSCWKTKEKFSSPVMYDNSRSKYVAVFNKSYIKLWNDEENFDKVKKYKFNKQIYSLFSNDKDIFILFENGNIYTLEDALQSRKTINSEKIFSDADKIEDVLYTTKNDLFYIGLIVRSCNELYLFWTIYNSPNRTFSRIKLSRDSFTMRGYVFQTIENSVHLLTLWSDGKMFSYSLRSSEPLFPGELFSVIDNISTKYTVYMLALNNNYIAMFGANCNDEGAILLIYNTHFKVTQSKQYFKLFAKEANLWNYENHILLPIGQNLAVVPFYINTEQLSALIGSHKIVKNCKFNADVAIVQEFEVCSWDDKLKLRDFPVPDSLKFQISNLLMDGLPESKIVEELLAVFINHHDLDALTLCINYFLDIPEKYLAKLLKYLITVDGKTFHNQSQDLSKSFSFDLLPIYRTKLIDKVLCKPFSEMLLLPHLHTEFTLSDIVMLLSYICFLWSENGHLLPSTNLTKTHKKLIKWSFVLIDANYQKLLLSKDNNVIAVLNQLNNLIEHHLTCFENFKYVLSILNYFKTNKVLKNCIGINNMTYCVEQVCFY